MYMSMQLLRWNWYVTTVIMALRHIPWRVQLTTAAHTASPWRETMRMISVRSGWWRAPDPIAMNHSGALILPGSSSPRTLEWWIKLDIPMLLGTWRRRLNQNVQMCSKKWVSFLLRFKLFNQIIIIALPPRLDNKIWHVMSFFLISAVFFIWTNVHQWFNGTITICSDFFLWVSSPCFLFNFLAIFEQNNHAIEIYYKPVEKARIFHKFAMWCWVS